MAGKEQWIKGAFRVLTEKGLSRMTIDVLAADLNLTKGSFYHHFKNMAVFRVDMLEYFESISTTSLIALVEADESQEPERKLERLIDLAVEPSPPVGLQIAIRAWAMQDLEVRKVQERLDQVRLDYASSLLRQAGCSPEESHARAVHLYLLLVGGRQILPPLPADQLREMCRRSISAPYLSAVPTSSR